MPTRQEMLDMLGGTTRAPDPEGREITARANVVNAGSGNQTANRSFMADLLVGALPFGPAISGDIAAGAASAAGSLIRGAGELVGLGGPGSVTGDIGGGAVQAGQAFGQAAPDLGLISTVGEGVGSTLPLLGLAFVNPSLAIGAGGMIGADEAAQRARAAGIGEGGVMAAAWVGGVTSALLERIAAPVKIAGRVSSQISRPGFKQAVTFAERMLDSSKREGLTEGAQALVQHLLEASYNPELDFFDVEAGKQILKEAALGALIGPILEGGTSVATRGAPAPSPLAAVDHPDAVVQEEVDTPAPVADVPFRGVRERMSDGIEEVVAVDQVANELSEHLIAASEIEVDSEEGFEMPQATVRATAADKYLLYGERARRVFERLDGMIPEGPMKQFFYDGTTDGWFRFNKRNKARGARLKQASFEVTGDEAGMSRIADRLTDHGIKDAKGAPVMLNGGERIMVYLHALNPDSRAKLADGLVRPDGSRILSMEEEQVTSILDSVTHEEKALGDWMMKEYAEEFAELSAAYEATTGKQLGEVENYVPAVGDTITEGVSTLTDPEHILALMQGAEPRTRAADTTQRGHTKARGEDARQRLNSDAFQVFDAHTRHVDFYIEMAPHLAEMRKVFDTKSFQDAINLTQGTAPGPRKSFKRFSDARGWLEAWIEDVGRTAPMSTDSGFGQASRWLRVNASSAYLGFKVGVGAKQTASTISAAAEYGSMRAMLSGWGALMKGGFNLETNSVVREMAAKVPELEFRNLQREIDELMTDIRTRSTLGPKWAKAKALQQKSLRMGLGMILSADRATVAAVAKGTYDAEIARGVSEKQAVEAARRIVQLTQPQSAVKDLPAAFREPEELAKILTTFSNQINQNWNMDIAKTREFKKGKKSKTDLAHYAAWRFIAISALLATIDLAGEPDEKDLTHAFIRNATAGMPGIGPLVSSALFAADIGTGFKPSGILGLPFAGPERVFRGADKIVDRDKDTGFPKIRKEKILPGLVDIVSGTGVTFGVPTDFLRVVGEGIESINKAEADAADPRTYLFSRFQRRNVVGNDKEDKPKGRGIDRGGISRGGIDRGKIKR